MLIASTLHTSTSPPPGGRDVGKCYYLKTIIFPWLYVQTHGPGTFNFNSKSLLFTLFLWHYHKMTPEFYYCWEKIRFRLLGCLYIITSIPNFAITRRSDLLRFLNIYVNILKQLRLWLCITPILLFFCYVFFLTFLRSRLTDILLELIFVPTTSVIRFPIVFQNKRKR